MNLAKAIKLSILTTLTLSATAFSLKKTTRPLTTHCMWTPPPNNFPRSEDTNSLKYTNVVEIANQYLSENRQISNLSLEKTIREAADEATGVINMRRMKKPNSPEPKELSIHKKILGNFLNQEPESNSRKKESADLEELYVNQVMNRCRNLI